ncbi:MAG: NAD(P)/FAD-dependent oxidoreductase [Betaproteobacteria bacterium]|nr:NAD(P)/FAD-dependent oxidoreductase [Betaproteobacteria bacterium]
MPPFPNAAPLQVSNQTGAHRNGAQSAGVVIVGAGAAGMMCAIEAGKRGREVVLIDHAKILGEKIRISGGGRCNFANKDVRPEHYLSANPHFCRSALARYAPRDFIALMAKHGIAWHERKHGQLFCAGSAQQIIDMLKAECDDAGVRWCMPAEIDSIEKRERFVISTNRGIHECASLVIATGGLSIPQLGASPFGYRIAGQFGLAVTPLRAGLVGLTFAPDTLVQFAGLAGISIDASVSCNGASFREALLVTHRGLSGPSILQISTYWKPGQDISVNVLPGHDAMEILERSPEKLLANALGEFLPQRLAERWAEFNFENQPVKRFNAARLREIAARLHDWRIRPSGTVGYKKAEVTLGGVDTRELSSKTMEASKHPGLYFIGEVVDVTGHLGGYNFQWAWASGYAAGQVV